MNGKCSVQRLAAITLTSTKSAAKAITYHQSGLIIRDLRQGHRCKWVGTMCGWVATHGAMIWDLYLDNFSRPVAGYVEELERMSGLVVSAMTICRWFQAICLFKATMWVTSSFPYRQDSWLTYHYICQYLNFVLARTGHYCEWTVLIIDI